MDGDKRKGRESCSITTGSESTSSKRDGLFLHTKHAFPPNSLGYCGPDVRAKILDYLHSTLHRENLKPVLTKFEAAYPFVKMIAKSTGRDPFDFDVTEAYWLGNSLLDNVKPAEFFEFANGDLSSARKMAGKSDSSNKEEIKSIFQKLGHFAKPHHTFYVLGMYARSNVTAESEDKLLELMDSCRISWGKVIEVKKDSLVVERPALALRRGRLALTSPKRKVVTYDPEIAPFSSIHKGHWVSVHWNFASEKLLSYQVNNLKRYTELDIGATNILAASHGKRS